MKECWVTEPLHFEMRETEIPEPKDNEVQIKMMAAGVCGSDIHIYKGENPNSRYPLIPGHENVGLVTKVGADCKNIKVGDHVVIDYVIRCGECYQCKHGRGNVCDAPVFTPAAVGAAAAHQNVLADIGFRLVSQNGRLGIVQLVENHP